MHELNRQGFPFDIQSARLERWGCSLSDVIPILVRLTTPQAIVIHNFSTSHHESIELGRDQDGQVCAVLLNLRVVEYPFAEQRQASSKQCTDHHAGYTDPSR
ncbi:hypothetical protein AR465_16830 [Ralstonia solanacearum]|nr:hypothetical protein AR465_16830 [Ralstonia solanacearum]